MTRNVYDKKIVAERLKTLRKSKGWTQQELSERSGVPKDSIKSYETARRIPDSFNCDLLCKTFGVTINYLLGQSNYKNKWDEYDHLHPLEVAELRKEYQVFDAIEVIGTNLFNFEKNDDTEFHKLSKYIELYPDFLKEYTDRKERKMNMKTRNDVKVIMNNEKNQVIDDFENGTLTVYATSEEKLEQAFQNLVKRGMISE